MSEASKPSAPRRVGCASHCVACGCHFSSDVAFDAHRQGPWEERHCADPDDIFDKEGRPRLVARSEDGVCNLTCPEPITGVVVWTLRVNMERDLSQLRALNKAAA